MSERTSRDPGRFALLLLPLAVFLWGWGDRGGGLAREAEESYRQGNYARALEFFQEAREVRPEVPELSYDLGVVHYRQEAWEDAAGMFRESLGAGQGELRPKGHFNLGNSLFKQGDYAGAVEAYRRTLEIRPDDMDAKFNLELALLRLQDTSSPQPQVEESGESPEEEESSPEEESPEGSPEEHPEEEEESQEGENEEEESPPPEEGGTPPQAPAESEEMSPEDAERLLDALRDEETRLMEERRRSLPAQLRVSHDW